jgi:formimidoylglutamate deiminase
MRRLHAAHALLPQGWARQVAIEVDEGGDIAAVTPGAPVGDERLDVVLPGVPNLHSHAFQRAMAGLAERRSPGGRDSFWTWRDTMYRFVSRFTPELAEAIAAGLYAELLRWGFTHVSEFHYLHRPQGAPPTAAAAALVAAAREAGIGMTLMPSLYAHGGIFALPPRPEQAPFLHADAGQIGQLLRFLWLLMDEDPEEAQVGFGVAPHSLRAVTPALLRDIVAIAGNRPIHIHAAEQPREVAECVAATGMRPVRWLLDNMNPDRRWCVVHATHMDEAELRDLAASGAVAGLCPGTEASLGDGVFRLAEWRAAGGRFGVGTDSHVGVSARDELRLLELSQRLRNGVRAVATDDATPSPGRVLLDAVLAGGAQASGRRVGAIAPGLRADLLVLDGHHPTLAGRGGDALLDSWIFSGQDNPIRHVLCGGRWVVREGEHVRAERIVPRFRAAMQELADAA